MTLWTTPATELQHNCLIRRVIGLLTLFTNYYPVIIKSVFKENENSASNGGFADSHHSDGLTSE